MTSSREEEIERLRAQRDVEGLIKALADEDGWIRKRAADALGELGDERAIAALRKALDDFWEPALTGEYRGEPGWTRPEVRYSAAQGSTCAVEGVSDGERPWTEHQRR